MVAGRQSTTALDRRVVQRNPSQSRSLDLEPSTTEQVKQGHLGMSSELAAWWGDQGAAGGMGDDPLQGWLGREQQARAVYKRWGFHLCCFPLPVSACAPSMCSSSSTSAFRREGQLA